VIQIKKYPNRRYYDATRSRHVTLQEVYDLVVEGHDVCVTDSRTGEDITNLILLQVMLEKDQPKLDVFPSSILHLMIRSNRQALHSVFEAYFGPFLKMMASSQRQFDSYLRQTMGGAVRTPVDWANEMMRAFSPGAAREEAEVGPPPPDFQSGQEVAHENVEELRRQVAELTQAIRNLQSESRSPDRA
jgi:polyhydroxyalkanoate synthesis repressor PhaR